MLAYSPELRFICCLLSLPMDASKSTIKAFFAKNAQYLAPVYQRNYAWQPEPQCLTLWHDLAHVVNKDVSKHFLGSIVLVVNSTASVSKRQIIDGQQRLTTIALLMVAMRDHMHSLDPNGIDLVRNLLKSNDGQTKLVLNSTDQEILLRLINGEPEGSFSTQDKQSCLWRNYEFFRNQLQGKALKGHEEEQREPFSLDECKQWLNCLGSNLEIARILLDQKDNPQRVFECLNSTGLDLSDSDLIRNFVLMSTNGEQQERELYEKFWFPFERLFTLVDTSKKLKSFFMRLVCIQFYLNGKKYEPNEDAVYPAFKEVFAAKATVTHTALDYAQELFDYGWCYARIVGFTTEDDTELASLWYDLQLLNCPKAVMPIIMHLYYSYHALKILAKEDLIYFGRLLISLVIRNAVYLDSNSSKKNEAAARDLFTGLKGCNDLAPVLQRNFAKQLYNQRFPNDEVFAYRLGTMELYKANPTIKLDRFVLNHLAFGGQFSLQDMASFTIEHIMPQTLNALWQHELGGDYADVHACWLHRLGNLTLTTENSELSNRPFAEKKQFFKRSDLKLLNSYLLQCEHWTERQIEERSRQLVQRALTLWPSPRFTVEDAQVSMKQRANSSKYSFGHYSNSDELVEAMTTLNEHLMVKGTLLSRQMLDDYVCYLYLLRPIALMAVHGEEVKFWLKIHLEDIAVANRSLFSSSHDIVPWGEQEVSLAFRHKLEATSVLAIHQVINQILNKSQ